MALGAFFIFSALTLALKSGILGNIHGVKEVAKNSQWKRFRDFLLMSTSMFALVASNTIMSSRVVKENTKTENNSVSMSKIRYPVQTISFRNDTLDYFASALLTYCNNQIIRNFVKDSKVHRMQLPYFSHEKWHDHNKKFVYWKKIKYAPSQFIGIRMHEEISANVAAILTADFEYQFLNNKQAVIKKYENTYMKFYFDAIKDGIIIPQSTDSLERGKKFDLLMNGTITMWEQKFRTHYTPSLISSLKQYLKNYGFYKPHNNNYHRALMHLYSLGGIDLSKYIKKDAEFIDIRLKMCDELADVKSFNKSIKQRTIVIDNIFGYGNRLRQFPKVKQEAVMQHLFIASKLKYELEKLKDCVLDKNSAAITTAYNKVMYQLATDQNFKKMILNCADFELMNVPFDDKTSVKFFPVSNLLNNDDLELIRSFYQFRDVDLTQLIQGFNVNDKPLDNEAFMTFSGRYFASQPIEKLIFKLPQNFNIKVDGDNQELPADASLSLKSSNKKQKIKAQRRMSKNLFVNIPNFEEPLLVPDAMTKESEKKLKELFSSYDSIPDEFKNCDIEATEKYVGEHGNPHYFENKKSPFKPNYHKKGSLNLATRRKMKQAQR